MTMERRRLSRFLPVFLMLAAPLEAATYVVTTNSDAGPGSLRAAISNANDHPGADSVVFSIPGAGVHTIRLKSELPDFKDTLTVDGYTQPGSRPNTLSAGDDAVIMIELSGEDAPGGTRGLVLTHDGCSVRGLAINRFHEASVGSGGAVAIDSEGKGELITGNFIGTDPTGTIPLGNTEGILLVGKTTRVGGTAPEDRNIVSGSENAVGIRIEGDTDVVSGNLIGTDASGLAPIPNHGSGVFVEGGSHHFVGGTLAGSGNVVAFNQNGGVVTAPGAGVAILGNSIFDNLAGVALGGIDLGYDGLSPNDACDADSGDKNRQNFPVLASAVSSEGAVDVAFTLESAPNRTYRIEFFASATCDDSGYGQGRFYLGAVNVSTVGCSAAATAHLDVCLTGDFVVTATATDPDGNTSEFSACRALEAGANASCSSRRIVPVSPGQPVLVRRPRD
jgi:hypothetical protein